MAQSIPVAMTDLPDRDEESGKWQSKFTDEDVLQVVKETDGFATSGDVHRELDCSYDTARRRLQTLVEDGKLETMNVAGTNVYSVPDNDH